ncbi:chitinase [Heliobacterium chlorum]|uniref:Chitinase n=1 Tax=Heliobacterium chlorum TaxID=2698 RepID=A0ABR7SZJ6_HELCL|nr:glycosyl hydrolase family 18 protein [Heliobacterium chlorum]MBC9783115.1 chitinase [Heliobacterium chlorum]
MSKKLRLFLALLLMSLFILPLPVLAAKKVTTKPTSPTGTTTSTGTTTTASPTTVTGKTILGYYPVDYSGDKTAYNSVANYGSSFNAISTFTYRVDGQGNLTGTAPADGITLAKSKSMKAYALIHNYINGGFDQTTASTLLGSATARQNVINRLKTILPANGYNGVNVDLENVKGTDRANYSQFIKEMKGALGPLGYTVIVSVPGKTYNDTTSSWGGAFDFTALGQSADFVQIMTYDEHWFGGTPGPIASIGYVTKAVQYATSAIPKEKILLGIATYGYDWYGSSTKTVTYLTVPKLLSQYNVTSQWDDTAKCPWFTYTDSYGQSHQVWYENAQSTSYKLDLVNQYGLGGIGIWRLGFEDQSFWDIVNSKLK